jgi:hypothetical protein
VIVIKLLLSALLFSCAILAFVHRSRARGVTLVITAVAIIGIVFVWNQEITNTLANQVGIGRGADLILYLFISISFGVSTLLYMRIIELQEHVTILTREIALLNASYENDSCASAGQDGASST